MYAAYSRIEAHYYQIDLLEVSCRKFCNLVLEWLMDHVDPEVWDKEYKDLFFGDPDKHRREQEARKRLAPAKRGEQGSLNINRKHVKPVADISMFTGRASNIITPQDSNDAKGAGLSIGPDSDGNLRVDTTSG